MRRLVEYKVEDTILMVDVFNSLLFKKANPINRIGFDYLQYTGHCYLLYFDTLKKEISYDDDEVPEVYELEIPEMVDLDRTGMLLKYSLDKDNPLLRKDHDFQCDPLLLQNRVGGCLPEIDILGDKFRVEWEKRILIEVSNPKNQIDLLRLDTDIHCCYFRAFYDMELKNVVKITTPDQLSNENIAAIELPTGAILDPYAVGLEWKAMPMDKFMQLYPIQKELKAERMSLKGHDFLNWVCLSPDKAQQQRLNKIRNVKQYRKGI